MALYKVTINVTQDTEVSAEDETGALEKAREAFIEEGHKILLTEMVAVALPDETPKGTVNDSIDTN